MRISIYVQLPEDSNIPSSRQIENGTKTKKTGGILLCWSCSLFAQPFRSALCTQSEVWSSEHASIHGQKLCTILNETIHGLIAAWLELTPSSGQTQANPKQ